VSFGNAGFAGRPGRRSSRAPPAGDPERERNGRVDFAVVASAYTNSGFALANAGATTLDQEAQHDDEQSAGDDPGKQNIVHIMSPFSQWVRKFLNDSIIRITAGPRVTRNRQGKIKSTSGKMSLIVVFAAISSTAWTR
jgi:hypothetical protein